MSYNNLSNAVERMPQAASRDKKLQFAMLWHQVYNIDNPRKSYCMLKRDAPAGIDSET